MAIAFEEIAMKKIRWHDQLKALLAVYWIFGR